MRVAYPDLRLMVETAPWAKVPRPPWRRTEVPELQRRVGSDAALAEHDLVVSRDGATALLPEMVRDTQNGLELSPRHALLREHLTYLVTV